MAEENPEDEALALYAKDCSIKTYMAVHSFRHELPTFIISGDNRVTVPSLGLISDWGLMVLLDLSQALSPSQWIKQLDI